jgi:hypothetical protein
LSRNESGRFGALKSDSTHHFFRNAWEKIVFLLIFRNGEPVDEDERKTIVAMTSN